MHYRLDFSCVSRIIFVSGSVRLHFGKFELTSPFHFHLVILEPAVTFHVLKLFEDFAFLIYFQCFLVVFGHISAIESKRSD